MTTATRVLLQTVIQLARKAGLEILRLYQSENDLAVSLKENETPVTDADYVANDIIREGLSLLTPEIPVISEEMAQIPYEKRKNWSLYWLVDPLDGTKEFLNRTDDFTVNIALIENHKPVMGVIYLPVFDTMYYAMQHEGAFKQKTEQEACKIQTRLCPKTPTVMTSRRHNLQLTQKAIDKLKSCHIVQRGSSIKSCLIAEGLADVYPAFGAMSEWDIAAAQCIVEQAGGAIWDESFQSMRYNKRQTLLIPKLLVVGDTKHSWAKYLNFKE